MSKKTMGEIICNRRKELGLTQRELAEKLNVTDKAVSKWERDLSCPDINTIPRVAEELNISLEELMNAKPRAENGHRGAGYLMGIILKAVPLAMGVAVVVAAVLGQLSTNSGFIMLGIGLFCVGADRLEKKKE